MSREKPPAGRRMESEGGKTSPAPAVVPAAPNHTPLPWTLVIARTMAHVHGPNGYVGLSLPYKTADDKGRAALIVRAVNHHEQLVEALRPVVAPLRLVSYDNSAVPTVHIELFTHELQAIRDVLQSIVEAQ